MATARQMEIPTYAPGALVAAVGAPARLLGSTLQRRDGGFCSHFQLHH